MNCETFTSMERSVASFDGKLLSGHNALYVQSQIVRNEERYGKF